MIIDYVELVSGLVKIFFSSMVKITGLSEYDTLICITLSLFVLAGYCLLSVMITLPSSILDISGRISEVVMNGKKRHEVPEME
jgi:protein-S-isoprenylcysteine O-methyltransferase Ste14